MKETVHHKNIMYFSIIRLAEIKLYFNHRNIFEIIA